jgi:hypothetical protein
MALSHHQLDAIAKCAVSGLPTADIAAYAGCSQATVTKLLRGGHDPEFDALYADWQRKATSAVADHRFKLAGYRERAYAAIGDALRQTKDLRLRFEVAKWLFEQLGLARQAPVTVNVGLQANVATETVTLAIREISEHLTTLVSDLRQQRPAGWKDPHESVG